MTIVKLGDIYDITSGGTPSRGNKEYYYNGNIPWIKTGDLKTKYVTTAGEFITNLGLENSSAKLFPKGTVLIAMYGATIGSCSILGIEASTNQACAAFRPIDKVLPEFLYYYLTSIKEKLVSLGVGGAQPNISIGILENIDFPMLTLDKQKKVVSILNRSQELIEKRKAQIEALDQLTQSVFLEMFGDPITNTKKWEIVTFQDVINSIRYGTSTPPECSDSGYKFIRATNIKKGKIVNENMLYINEVEASKLERCKLILNELIFVRSGVNSGDNAIVTKEFAGHYGGYDIIVNVNSNVVNPYYLNSYFNSVFLDLIIKPLTRRAGQPHLNADQIKNLKIQLPPIDLQREYADIYEKIEINKLTMIESVKLLEQNFNSLIQRAFKGELFTAEKVSNL